MGSAFFYLKARIHRGAKDAEKVIDEFKDLMQNLIELKNVDNIDPEVHNKWPAWVLVTPTPQYPKSPWDIPDMTEEMDLQVHDIDGYRQIHLCCEVRHMTDWGSILNWLNSKGFEAIYSDEASIDPFDGLFF